MIGVRRFSAITITDTQFQLVIPFGLLAEWIDDPNPDPRRGRKRNGDAPTINPRAERVKEMHAAVQREFKGAKRTNLPAYRKYINALIDGRHYGDLPEVVLWTETTIPAEETGSGVTIISIPVDAAIGAIDGETQIAARFDLLHDGKGALYPIVIRFHHAITIADAAQIFADRNTRGVDVPKALAITRDYRDPVMAITRAIVDVYPALFTVTGEKTRISIATLREAAVWSILRAVREPRRHTFDVDTLTAARGYLIARIGALLSLFDRYPATRRAPIFIAAMDRSVTLRMLEAINWNDPEWIGYHRSATGASVRAMIDRFHRTELPFPQHESDEPGPEYRVSG